MALARVWQSDVVRGRHTCEDDTDRWSRRDWWGVVLEAPDARALAQFYAELLGWSVAAEDPEHAAIAPPDGVAYLAFQTSPTFQAPAWPPRADAPQMSMHLDFQVSDLDAAVEHAVALGATLADHQPQDGMRVLADPAGHPFCLYLDTDAEAPPTHEAHAD